MDFVNSVETEERMTRTRRRSEFVVRGQTALGAAMSLPLRKA